MTSDEFMDYFNVTDDVKSIAQMIYNCYHTNTSYSRFIIDGLNVSLDLFCPRTFDGFACWDDTPAGKVATQKCPEHIIGFDSRRDAIKQCLENGSWFGFPGHDKPWSNYTDCVDVDDLKFRIFINTLYTVGYAVSSVGLLLSLFIFTFFRSNLWCTRVKVHCNLFLAMVLNNIFWMIWYTQIVNSADVVMGNPIWCQMNFMTMHYFMVSTYFWMFCESLNLYFSLVIVFNMEEKAMKYFVPIGWVAPVFIMAFYAWFRYFILRDTVHCLMDETKAASYIYRGPVIFSLGLSFCTMVIVVCTLIKKLQGPNQRRFQTIKKAVRAVCLLVPLLGMHFFIFPVRPTTGTLSEKIYDLASAVLTGFQGTTVAILFCFKNKEVKNVIRNYFSRNNQRSNDIPMTGATGGDSTISTRENVHQIV